MHEIDYALREAREELEASEAFEGEAPSESFEAHDELALAAELLSVTDEAELDQFLGKLIKGVGKVIKSPVGRALGGILKSVAKKALPLVGNLVAPGIGGLVGAGIASALKTRKRPPGAERSRDRGEPDDQANALASASEIFGMELEGLSFEDQEFEIARQFVRFAVAATQELDEAADASSARPAAIAAVKAAAETHAPGLFRELPRNADVRGPDSGRWIPPRSDHRVVRSLRAVLSVDGDHEASARSLLGLEARALLTRLLRVRPLALQEPMLPAAALSPAAQAAIERHLVIGRRELRAGIVDFLDWIDGPDARRVPACDLQRQFVALRLRFNVVLSQFDLFSDVIAQRSEHETGVWLAGLDTVAEDTLRLPGGYFDLPPLACYLDRGAGGAIRRARTRLPGGGMNPVAIIRIPRERMIGTGIASSLAHEVGHQGTTLLDLLASLRPTLQGRQESARYGAAWALWERWMGEVLADLWAIARVGVASTLGLIGVVSLPRAFVFQLNAEDPHPVPWIRVLLSCALGAALYPDPQWAKLARLWECLYPVHRVEPRLGPSLAALKATLPELAALLIEHRPPRLGGESLGEALADPERAPGELARLHGAWYQDPRRLRRAAPSLAFAVIGQARFDGVMTPEDESRVLADLLTGWALGGTLARAAPCPQKARYTALHSSIE